MIALFFEVLPKPGQDPAYFDMAAKLKPALDLNGGLLFLDRSRSASRPGWFLSHQFWADEASMVRWRANPAHHHAQICGRADIMQDYRLRVGEVVASLEGSKNAATQLPSSSEPRPTTTRRERYLVSVMAGDTACSVPPGAEVFASVYDKTLVVAVVPVASRAEGLDVVRKATEFPGHRASRLCRIIRDYGMFARAEAPQHFDPVTLA